MNLHPPKIAPVSPYLVDQNIPNPVNNKGSVFALLLGLSPPLEQAAEEECVHLQKVVQHRKHFVYRLGL